MANKVLEILIKLAKSGTGAADAARDIGAIDTSSGRAEKGLRDTEQAAKKTGTAFKELGSKIKSMGSSFLNTFKSLKIEALAFAGILAGTVREAVMNNINIARAWTMSSTMGFKEMRTEVRNLSMELGVAKDKISSGLYQALSAGVPEDNVFKFLETASKVAVADGSDVAVAVDGITTVLNAFKIEADNTGKVADLMFQTVSNGKTTFSDLASNLSTVAPLAASTGIGIEQILAATATLTKQGTPTAQAMTQIRESIRALNNNLGDGWSKTRTFQEAVQELARKANGSQTELSKIVGSVEALVGVLGLTGENATAAKEDLEDLEKASGALDTAYEKVDKFRHWSKLWETSRAAISRVGEVIDEAVAPAVEAVTESLKEWIADEKLFDAIADKVAGLRDTIQGLWDAVVAGKGAEVAENIGQTIYGYLWKAGEKIAEILIDQAKAIGEKIGENINPVSGLKGKWEAGKELVNEGELNWPQALVGMLGDLVPAQGTPSDRMEARRDGQDGSAVNIASAADQYLDEVRKSRERLIEETKLTSQAIGDSITQQEQGARDAREQITTSAESLTTASQEAADSFEQGQALVRDQLDSAAGETADAAEKLNESAEALADTGEALGDAAEVIPAAADEATGRIDAATEQTANDLDSAATTASQATADMSATLVASVRNFTDATSRGLGDAADNIDRSLSSFQQQIESINQRLSTIATVASNAEYEAQLANDRLRVMT